MRRFENSRNVEVSARRGKWRSRFTSTNDHGPYTATPTFHDHESRFCTLCLYSLNIVNVSLKRDVGAVVDIRLARPAYPLPGFRLAVAGKWTEGSITTLFK
jgi:hypothetical protein